MTAGLPEASPWRRTLWIMVGVQFIMGMALSVIAPIIPLLLPQIGVSDPGEVNFWSGILNSLNFLIAAFVSPLWGAVGDRYGRKPMVLRASLAIAGFTALMGVSTTLWQFVALTAMMGAFSGFSSSAIALVATQTPELRLGFALGWLATGQLVGSLIGPVIGGLIADGTGASHNVFFFTAIAAAIAAAVAQFGIREQFDPSPRAQRPSPWHGLAVMGRTKALLPLLVVLLMAQFGIRAVLPVITPLVQQMVGDAGNLATLSGLAFSIAGIADIIASPLFGRRSDTIGYRRVLLIGLAGAGVASIPQALVQDYWQFLALRFALGAFIGAVLPTAHALIGRLVPASDRGAAYGLAASATFFGSFLGPFTGGSIGAVLNVHWVFALTGVLFLLNCVWVFRLVPEIVGKREADDSRRDP